MNYNLMKLNINGDNDGHLIACQYESNCPFDVKRVVVQYLGENNG